MAGFKICSVYVSGTLSICQMMESSCQQDVHLICRLYSLCFVLSLHLFPVVYLCAFSRKDPENSDGGGKEMRIQHKATFFKLATEIKKILPTKAVSQFFFWKKKNKKKGTCNPLFAYEK